MSRLVHLPLLLCLIGSPAWAAPTQRADAKETLSSEETAQRAKLQHAQRLIAAGKWSDAIGLIDQVLAYYARRYPEGRTRWFVARTTEENLYYLTEATLSSGNAEGKSGASSLMVAWADAYYLKGYALNEQARTADAKAALARAVRLSPQNASYLIELAEAYKLERNWDECYQLYRAAETAAQFSPPELKLAEQLQAKRGQAFVFIEQGNLDRAEAILKACLKLDPNDARAKKELGYIAQLRKQEKRP